MRIWVPPELERKYGPPIVGVNGRPVVYGWGELMLALPAGDHIVEIQYGTSVRSELLTVQAGQVVPLEHCPEDNLTPPQPRSIRRRREKTGAMWAPIFGGLAAGSLVFQCGILLLINRTTWAITRTVPLVAAITVAVVIPLLIHARRRARRRR